jgi:transcriptional repressor NF-X1
MHAGLREAETLVVRSHLVESYENSERPHSGHPCPLSCHAPSACALDAPCPAIIEATCACGTVKQKVPCGSCLSRPESNGDRQLKCNDACALVKRNTALADALGVDTAARAAATAVEWPAELVATFLASPAWAMGVEVTLGKLVETSKANGTGKGSHLFPPMRWQQRQFVHEVAERYGLESESLDAEPNRRCVLVALRPSVFERAL